MKSIVFMKPRVGYRGGLEKHTRLLIEAFSKKGCPVTLLTTGSPPPIKGATTFSLAPDSKFTLYQLIHFNNLCQKWLSKHPHEIIFGMERTTYQTHYRAGNGVHAVYLQRRKMVDSLWKKVVTPLNPLQHLILKMEKEAFESPQLKVLFTNSNMVREEILQFYKTPAEKIEVVHNGVEWCDWQRPFEEGLRRKRGPYHFLFIGNGYRRKGLHFFFYGLEQFKEEDFVVTVVGKEKNQSYFVALAKKLGLAKKIAFKGAQKEVIPFYQAADALVLPSIYDPFANVTVEALAMGLFVVTSPFNGGAEILNPETGVVIEDLTHPGSVAVALSEAFKRQKTEDKALKIRNTIKYLDFSLQLDKIVEATLTSY